MSVVGIGVRKPVATWESGSDACRVAGPRPPSDPNLFIQGIRSGFSPS